MVREQIERRGVRDARVLAAMRAVPRHLFLPENARASAYDDTPLPIGSHQTISQPYIVAYMTEALKLRGTERVLEIGTGSGYQTAVLACLSDEVYSIERIPELADCARRNLHALGISRAEVVVGDGTCGSPEHAPFDAIVVTAGTPAVPQPLLDQMAPRGRLIAPVGGRSVQELELWIRSPSGIRHSRLTAVVFVPLIGVHGWNE
ncbi:MAG: protein-L-isoaspartate(D-aspartate) O-methyltransferase [Anaerolineales bacterium]|nr:protein-L-isoaspartate(D-aspartate) O-methyltransferase [Anaerolineales bacterium]